MWFIVNTVNIKAFREALKLFAEEVGTGENKRIIFVMDNAGWHTSAALEGLPNIQPEYLPPYTPELQPAERLWTLTDEPLANKIFATLNDLEQVLGDRCRQLYLQPEVIKSHTHFHWWPRTNQSELIIRIRY